MAALTPELAEKYRRLREDLARRHSLLVGMSGGVDSVLLAKVAHDVLGARMLAVTADSPSLPRRELREAVETAERAGIPLEVISTDELGDPRYAANPRNRCYFCRTELFTKLQAVAAGRGFRWVAYGENLSDGDDHRPGAQAAAELRVCAPLKDAGLSKDDIRRLAAHLGLPVADKPAFACLASRLPPGTPVTAERLGQVERGEDALAALGFAQYRVRHHGDVARIEVPPEDMEAVVSAAPRIVAELRRAGFRHVALDLAGYQRGSLSRPLRTIGRGP